MESSLGMIGVQRIEPASTHPVHLAQNGDVLFKIKQTILLTPVYCFLILYDKYNNLVYKIDIWR
jgi:hypothetical protein